MAESKWGIQAGLVLNLPHGMDGQGPEHSSGRIERFLCLSDDDCDSDLSMKYEEQILNCNIQVVCCSTSANYFHVLRRQLRRDYRKPLINFNSKRLLKFKPVIFYYNLRPVSPSKTSFRALSSLPCTKIPILRNLKKSREFFFVMANFITISRPKDKNSKDKYFLQLVDRK